MSLLLHHLPKAHFSEAHSILIHATPERILSCVATVEPNDDTVIARLIGFREKMLPYRLGIRLASGLIRQRMLELVKTAPESAASA